MKVYYSLLGTNQEKITCYLDTTNVTITVIIITIIEIVKRTTKLGCFVKVHKASISIIITAAIITIHSSFMAIIAMTMICY